MRIRQRILHLIERDLPVATALPSVDVLGSSAAATEHLRNGLGRECELTRSGNQHDAAKICWPKGSTGRCTSNDSCGMRFPYGASASRSKTT